MCLRAGFERAYAQGVIAGVQKCHRRVMRVQVTFLLTLGLGIVAVGAAWDHPNRPPAVIQIVEPIPSLMLTSSQRSVPGSTTYR